MQYKRELDGLRAIAVLSVVIFHAYPKFLPGGFVGVDVFFVISGYIISLIIFQDIEKFNVLNFFYRRVIRLFPSLIAVLIFSLILGWWVLFSEEYVQLSRHIASGVIFVTNFALIRESGYFDNASDMKPMLHLWSLSVEEQFYLIFPFLILLFKRRPVYLLISIIFSIVVSFVFNVHFIDYKPTFVFFSPFSRFWELLSGSLLAWFVIFGKNNFRFFTGASLTKYKEIFLLFGFLLLFLSIFILNKNDVFPGILATIPVFIAVVIISSSKDSVISKKILCNPILVSFGVISYPLYLWHWPILTFSRIYFGSELTSLIKVIAIFTSVVLSILTYKFIENPIRKGRLNSKITCFLMIVCMIVIFIFCVCAIDKKGFGNRPINKFNDIAFDNLNARKMLKDSYKFYKNESENIYLWGDSYADALSYPLGEILDSKGMGMIGFIKHSCPSLIDTIRNEPHRLGVGFSERCEKFTKKVQDYLKVHSSVYYKQYIVISSSYIWYSESKNDKNEPILISDKGGDNSDIVYDSLLNTIKYLNNLNFEPVLVLTHPEYSSDKIRYGIRTKKPSIVQAKVMEYNEFNLKIIKKLEGVNVIFIDPVKILCKQNSEYCGAFDSASFKWNIWKDGHHLSYHGGSLIAKDIVSEIEKKEIGF